MGDRVVGGYPVAAYYQPVYADGHRASLDDPYPRTFVPKPDPEPTTIPEPAVTTQEVQQSAEGVVTDDGKVDFLGLRVKLAETIGLMPLMAFANSAKNGMDSDDLDGLAAMYALVRDTVDQTRVQRIGADGEPVFDDDGDPVWEGPSDWQRFERHSIEQKADGDDFMAFIRSAMGVIGARPRKRRGTSSESSPRTSANSKASSSSPGTPVDPRMEGLTPVAELGR